MIRITGLSIECFMIATRRVLGGYLSLRSATVSLSDQYALRYPLIVEKCLPKELFSQQVMDMDSRRPLVNLSWNA
jgi:hypothetical protein